MGRTVLRRFLNVGYVDSLCPDVFESLGVPALVVASGATNVPVFAMDVTSLAVGLEERAVVGVGELELSLAARRDDQKIAMHEMVATRADADEVVDAGLASS